MSILIMNILIKTICEKPVIFQKEKKIPFKVKILERIEEKTFISLLIY